MENLKKKIAYLSMEFGLEEHIKTFSGGLGFLAGDHVKSAADLGADLIGIGLLYHEGYFQQNIVDGRQKEIYPKFDPSKYMTLRKEIVGVPIFGSKVKVGAWEYTQKGEKGNTTLLFLTTDIPENKGLERGITSKLYGGDQRTRIAQELVLGKGGIRLLHKLGIRPDVYHLNEGHGAFATLDLRYILGNKGKEKTVFTTHTPVAAGHDQFDYGLAHEAMEFELPHDIREVAGKDKLNMTTLAISHARKVNAVAYEHKLVSQEMFPNTEIDHVTNGVHSFTWTNPTMQKLFDQYIPQWREDPRLLSNATELIPAKSFLEARDEIRNEFFKEIKNRTGDQLDPEKITIGFARRFATYKRADLIFHDQERLNKIAGDKLQLVFAGKAHPRDEAGKDLIHKVNSISNEHNKPKVLFVPNYSMGLGKILTSGSDIWLNTPTRPKEASGTSGMKAAHNGVPHFSTVDGWHYEIERNNGNVKGGWDIGEIPTDFKLRDNGVDYETDSNSLYEVLEQEIIPLFEDKEKLAIKGLEAVENAGFFNTHRMVMDYYTKIYNN